MILKRQNKLKKVSFGCSRPYSLFSPQTENAATSNNPSVVVPPKSNDTCLAGSSNKLRVAASSMALLLMTPKQPRAATPTHPVHNMSSASNHPGHQWAVPVLTNLDGESDGEQLGMCVFHAQPKVTSYQTLLDPPNI